MTITLIIVSAILIICLMLLTYSVIFKNTSTLIEKIEDYNKSYLSCFYLNYYESLRHHSQTLDMFTHILDIKISSLENAENYELCAFLIDLQKKIKDDKKQIELEIGKTPQ